MVRHARRRGMRVLFPFTRLYGSRATRQSRVPVHLKSLPIITGAATTQNAEIAQNGNINESAIVNFGKSDTEASRLLADSASTKVEQ